MLGLKLATDPRWVNLVAENIEEILTDHAYCEQKAATNAIGLVIQLDDEIAANGSGVAAQNPPFCAIKKI